MDNHVLGSKLVSKLGKLPKSAENLIVKYLQEKKIELPLSESNSLILKVNYDVENLLDIPEVFLIALQTEYITLNIKEVNNLPNSNNLPSANSPKLKFIDELGELYTKKIYETNTSTILTKSKLTIIVGNSATGIYDSIKLLLEIPLKYNQEFSTVNISLGHINPNLELNHYFKAAHLKEFYKLLFEAINNQTVSRSRHLLNLIKIILQYCSSNKKYKINHIHDYYVEHENINNTVKVKDLISKGYLINRTSFLCKLNNDIVSSASIEAIRQTSKYNNQLDILLQERSKNSLINDGVRIPNNTVILTKTGVKSIEKLANTTVSIWNGEQWVFATISETDEAQGLVYIVFLADHTSFEVYDNTGLIKEDDTVVDLKDLKVGDRLKKSTIPLDYSYKDYYYESSGIVSHIEYNHYESKVYTVKVSDNYKNKNVMLPNCVVLKADIKPRPKEICAQELAHRNTLNYVLDEPLINKNTVLLDCVINCNYVDPLDLVEIENITKLATVCSSAGLLSKINRLNNKFKFTHNNLPVVNVSLSNVYSLLINIYKQIEYRDKIHRVEIKLTNTNFLDYLNLKYLSVDNEISKYININLDKELCIVTNKSKKVLGLITVELLLSYMNQIIRDTLSQYCCKHNLSIPIKYSSVLRLEDYKDYKDIKEIVSEKEQYNFIKLLDANYITHNSSLSIFYHKENLDKLAKLIFDSIKSNVSVPNLEFIEL